MAIRMNNSRRRGGSDKGGKMGGTAGTSNDESWNLTLSNYCYHFGPARRSLDNGEKEERLQSLLHFTNWG